MRKFTQHDAKKRDAQLDKTLQQWQKLANENARASSTALRGGMLLLNPVEPAQSVPRADSFWDPAINELNQQIISLQEECEAFRHVTLSIGNQLNNLLATANGEPVSCSAAKCHIEFILTLMSKLIAGTQPSHLV